MATAADPYIAADKMRQEVPDVITLDVEMPRMDGLTFLQKIMSQHPIPVVMCSSLAERGSRDGPEGAGIRGRRHHPEAPLGTKQFLEESQIRICDAVKAAASRRVRTISAKAMRTVPPKLTADAVLEKPARRSAMIQTTEKVVVVGASTGGTEALRVFLEALPPDAPGIVIVQHMPENFTAAFARRLDGLCRISVKEAADDDTVIRGRALIAPGNRHCCSSAAARAITSR